MGSGDFARSNLAEAHVDADGVMDVVRRDVPPGDVAQMTVLCARVCLDPGAVVRAVHDEILELV